MTKEVKKKRHIEKKRLWEINSKLDWTNSQIEKIDPFRKSGEMDEKEKLELNALLADRSILIREQENILEGQIEEFNARLDEEIKKLMGPDFSGTLDYDNGLVVKYKGIEERNIDTPGISKIVEMIAQNVAEELEFDLEIFMDNAYAKTM